MTVTTSRRAALMSVAAVGAAVATPAAVGAAAKAVASPSAPATPEPATVRKRISSTISVEPSPTASPTASPEPLDDQTRHVLNRFAYGTTPKLVAAVEKAGGITSWFDAQLKPSSVKDAATEAMLGWYPALSWSSDAVYAADKDGSLPGWQLMAQYTNWTLLRRIYSRRQVLEVMREFWTNLLYIPTDAPAYGFRMEYDRLVAQHALGTFEGMLQAVIPQAAMMVYLNGAVSVKTRINENLGRELLELHTVGRGNHTEDDVVNAARILTGYKVDMWRTWAVSYDPSVHWTGPVRVGSFTHANTDPDGRAVTKALLSHLARQPATARRIAHRMAQYFVADTPPPALVDRLAGIYLANDTAIVPMLREILASPEFAASARGKTSTPSADLVRTCRSLDVKIDSTDAAQAAKNSLLWSADGAGGRPFSWPRPDGEPMVASGYDSVGRVLGSFEMHWALAGGWWPSQGITYRPYKSWLPAPSVRLDALVEHLCQQFFAMSATPTIIQACCEAVGHAASETIDADHAVAGWKMPMLLVTLLNSPHHMMR